MTRKPYSVQQAKLDAIENQIRHQIILAKTNPDFKLKHPSEAREVSAGNLTNIKKRVKEDIIKHQKQAEARRLKKKNVK